MSRVLIAFVFLFSPLINAESPHSSNEVHTSEDHNSFHVGRVLGSIRDLKIPKPLVKQMEGEYIKSFRLYDSVRASALSESEIMLNSDRKYLIIKVEVFDEGSGALVAPTRFVMPRGGGIIDLAPLVTSKRANFRVKIQIDVDPQDQHQLDVPSLIRAYYVSGAKVKEYPEDIYGAGCNKFMDLTQFYKNQFSKNGIEVNTTDDRYISVLAGSYFFLLAHQEILYLGAIKFINSKRKDLLCPEV